MIMWNDAIDISKSPDIPRDIIIHFWRIAMPGRGPYEGCTFQRFLEESFTVINSHFPEAYAEEYIRQDSLLTWSPVTRPEHEERFNGQIWGGEACAWDVHEHFGYSLSATLWIFADRLCNNGRLELEEIDGKALSRNILDDEMFPYDIFKLLGSYILINKDKAAFFGENKTAGTSEVASAINSLQSLDLSEREKQIFVQPYIDCLSLLLEAKGQKYDV
jgi:hypothetical protein